MVKKLSRADKTKNGRSGRIKLTAEESLKRVSEFDKRKEQFVAALRKIKDRGVSS